MNAFLLFLILAAACGGYYLFSCWRFPARPVPLVRRQGATRPAAEAPVRPVRALRRQGLPGPLGHADDREAIMMMPWLEAAVGLSLAALVLVRWLGSHLHLLWRYAPRRRAAVTAKATVIRPPPAAHPRAIEPPRGACGTTSIHPAHHERRYPQRPS
jgi:hypothetical protein